MPAIMGKIGYLFISNSRVLSEETLNSMDPITVGSFAYAAIYAANELGYKLYMGINRTYAEKIACTNFDVQFYNANIFRDILDFRANYTAYKNLCKFLKEHPDIEIIHCNTPIGGVLGRICGKKFNKKVIYTAHGFHFYKSAPIKNWLLYYTAEKILARYTDILITINHEDYEQAKKFKLKPNGRVCYIPGVGIDLSKYQIEKTFRTSVRESLRLGQNDIAVFSMGDLVARKNYGVAIKAIKEANNKKIHYFICGEGPEHNKLVALAKSLNVENNVHFLGHRTDVCQLLMAADIFMLTSQQDGFTCSLMEGMAFGLPCLVSDIRGNADLIKNKGGGYLCSVNDATAYAKRLNQLANDESLRKQLGRHNLKTIKSLDINNIGNDALADVRPITSYLINGWVRPLVIRDVRRRLNMPESAFIIISIGDLNVNKNTECIIKAIAQTGQSVHLLICGVGQDEVRLKQKTNRLNIQDRVHFLGYRNDIVELLFASDAFVSASFREGLPRSTMEAMAAGLPCIVSRIRGNIDLVDENKGGILVEPKNYHGYANAIDRLCSDSDLRKRYGTYNLDKIKEFDIKKVRETMLNIYFSI